MTTKRASSKNYWPAGEIQQLPFMVLDLKRYYPESSYRARFGMEYSSYLDIYDIVLTDTSYKHKFVLSADARVKQQVQVGCVVKLTKITEFIDESRIEKELVVIIHELEILPDSMVNTAEFNNLPWNPKICSRHKENVPIASGKNYFADNWTFHVVTDGLDLDGVIHSNIADVDLSEVYHLKDIVAKKVTPYQRPLIVKVMRKSRLIQFYRDDKYPFQLPLVIADQSGWCTAVLWNKLALQFLNQFNEGDVLLLKNFRVKKGVQQKMKTFTSPPKDSIMFSMELGLEAHHPVSEIQILDILPQDDIQVLLLPELESCLFTCRDLISVPDFTLVDVVGMVTFVGRVEREVKKGSGLKDSGGFFYRRWIHLKDNSLDSPIIALIYAGDQPDMFMRVKPGDYLLCRHMLSCQRLADLVCSRQTRHSWLTTTAISWLYRFDPYSTEDLPEPFCEIVRGIVLDDARGMEHRLMEGGYFRYPPFSTSLEELNKTNQSILEKFLPSSCWKTVFSQMMWRESHQLALHATLWSVDFIQPGSTVRLRVPTVTKMPRISSCSTSSVKKKRKVSSPGQSSNNAGSDDSCSIGVSDPQQLASLWPVATSGQEEGRDALLIKWQGLNGKVTINTVKPCMFHSDALPQSLPDLLRGEQDSDLGLISADRLSLTSAEKLKLRKSAQELANSEFVLLVDVYTEDEGQVIVLNRAYHH